MISAVWVGIDDTYLKSNDQYLTGTRAAQLTLQLATLFTDHGREICPVSVYYVSRLNGEPPTITIKADTVGEQLAAMKQVAECIESFDEVQETTTP